MMNYIITYLYFYFFSNFDQSFGLPPNYLTLGWDNHEIKENSSKKKKIALKNSDQSKYWIKSEYYIKIKL